MPSLSAYHLTWVSLTLDLGYLSQLLQQSPATTPYFTCGVAPLTSDEDTEENNRMGKTRDLFKKIRDTKGIFHAKMGSIKDINGRDQTEAENIKKRWKEYTEVYKKHLHDPDNHNHMITHLEPNILECEVKWALESMATNKASGGDGIPVELFQILKDDAV